MVKICKFQNGRWQRSSSASETWLEGRSIMSIAINKALCKGCTACTKVCPGSLIKMDDDKKAYIRYPKDCWGCSSCIKECRFGAIALYLGADIGGMGSKMTVLSEENQLYWNILRRDGSKEQVIINKKESNKY